MSIIIEHYLSGVLLLGSIMFAVWLLYLATKNPGVVDVFWGLGLGLATMVLFFASTLGVVETILFILVWAWCLRLSLFLFFTRVAKKEQDARYMSLAEKWKEGIKRKFLVNFLFQALLQSFIFMSIMPITAIKHFINEVQVSVFSWFWIVLFVVSLLAESIADLQLYRFKQNISNRDKVCDIGLWRYSRHPNYFFEWTLWLSVSGFSISVMYSLMGLSSIVVLLAPITLWVIFFVFTIRLTEEQALKKRPNAYSNYQKTVSIFIPWFRKDT